MCETLEQREKRLAELAEQRGLELERSPRFGQPIEATAENGFDFGGYMLVDEGGVVLGMNSVYSSYDASLDDIEAWLSDPRDRWGMPTPGWSRPRTSERG